MILKGTYKIAELIAELIKQDDHCNAFSTGPNKWFILPPTHLWNPLTSHHLLCHLPWLRRPLFLPILASPVPSPSLLFSAQPSEHLFKMQS